MSGGRGHDRAKKRLVILQRRRQVAVNLLGGMTYREIARSMGVSAATIASDTKALRKEWTADAVHDIAQVVLLESRRLDSLLNAVWKEAMSGKIGAVKEAREIVNARMKLYGLDSRVLLEAVQKLTEASQPVTRDEDAGLSDSEKIALILDRAESRVADPEGDGGTPPAGGDLVN